MISPRNFACFEIQIDGKIVKNPLPTSILQELDSTYANA
jgi:hypothetical protein